MNIETYENALYTIINGIVGITCIWDKPLAQQPKRPYLTMDLSDIDKKGTDDFEYLPNALGVRTVYGFREFVLAIKCFGTSRTSAIQTLINLEMALGRIDIQEAFRASDIIYIDNDPVVDAAFPESQRYTDAATLNINFRVSTSLTYGGTAPVTVIDSVNIAYTIHDNDTDKTGTINVDGGA